MTRRDGLILAVAVLAGFLIALYWRDLLAIAALGGAVAFMWRRTFPRGSGSPGMTGGIRGWVDALSGLIAALAARKFAATYSRDHETPDREHLPW